MEVTWYTRRQKIRFSKSLGCRECLELHRQQLIYMYVAWILGGKRPTHSMYSIRCSCNHREEIFFFFFCKDRCKVGSEDHIFTTNQARPKKLMSLSAEAEKWEIWSIGSIEPNKCRVIRHSVGICLACYCQWCSTDNVDNWTSESSAGNTFHTSYCFPGIRV